MERLHFFADVKTQYAVIRSFEVVGKAAKRIPDESIHQYEGVSIIEIWQIVEKDLDPLRRAITGILPPLEDLERQIAGDNE